MQPNSCILLPPLPHCCLQVCAPLQQHGVAFGLGVHPWHAHTVEGSGWLQQLRELLHEHPTAIVGEIGLDKAATTPDTGKCEFEAQLQCFRMQLELAAEMNRAVSVHSVRCHGQMLSLLREIADDLPPAVALHSFTGSSQIVDSLVKMPKGAGQKIYFGFSKSVNLRRQQQPSKKLLEVLAAVPLDRLLLESDQHSAEQAVSELDEMCLVLANAKAVPVSEMALLTNRNARRFLGESE